jgi:hypothetical protein
MGESVAVAVNNGTDPVEVILPWEHDCAVDIFTGRNYSAEKGKLPLQLEPRSGMVLKSC